MVRKLIGVLVLKHVPSWNALYRYGKGRMYKTRAGRDFERLVKSIVPVMKRRKVILEVYADKGKRKWDIDNLLKSILDSLKGLVYNDDESVIGIVAFKYKFHKRRVEIRIWEVKRKSGVYPVRW